MPKDIKHKLIRLIPAASIICGLVITVMLVLWLKDWLSSGDNRPQKKVQQITVIAPPPPPPPVEQPPEPEVQEEVDLPEEVTEDVPEDAPEPVGADLGVDGDGTVAGDGFGLIGKKGGCSILVGSPFAYYEGLMVSELQDLLANIDELKSEEYRLRIKIRVAFDGSVESVKLLNSTGAKDKDRVLMAALKCVNRFSIMPPGELTPVVGLSITSSF